MERKKFKTKNILSMLLAVLLMAGMIPFAAPAEAAPSEDIADYTLYVDMQNKVLRKNTAGGEIVQLDGIVIDNLVEMNDFHFKTTASPAMLIESDATISMMENTENSIETTAATGDVIGLKASVNNVTFRSSTFGTTGTLNIIAGAGDSACTSKTGILAEGQSLQLTNYSNVFVTTGNVTTLNGNTYGVKCARVDLSWSSVLSAVAGAGGNSGVSFGIVTTGKVAIGNTLDPASMTSTLIAAGHNGALRVESSDTACIPAITGNNAVAYRMSTNYSGDGAADNGYIVQKYSDPGPVSRYVNAGNQTVKWMTLGALKPVISIGSQSGTLTYGDTTNKTATYAVTASSFDPMPTQYSLAWTNSVGSTVAAPKGLSRSIGTVTDGACTVTVTNSGADAGDYYFTLKYFYNGNDVVSKPAKIAVAKATMTDEAILKKAVSVKADKISNSIEVSLPELPAGASYGTVTMAGNPDGLLMLAPTVSGSTLTYNSNSKSEGATAACKVAVTGATNYENYEVLVTFTAKNKESVEITGLTGTGNVTYDGKVQKGYTGTASSGDYTGNLEVKWTGTPAAGGSYSSTTDAPKDAGSYKVTISVPDTDETYTGSKEFTYSIDKKAVTAQAKDETITVGVAMPEFELYYDGIVSGDTITPDGPYTPAFSVRGNENVVISDTNTAGTYTIYWSNADSAAFTNTHNYTVTADARGGKLTINTPSKPSNPKVTVTTDGSADDIFDINVPSSLKGEANKVKLPLSSPTGTEGSGMVPIIIEPKERAGEYVPKSMLDDGTVVFLVDETMKVEIVDNSKPFSDVKNGDWFSDNVDFVSAREIFAGTGGGKFSPSLPVTRGMFAAVLWRTELKPEETGIQFGDIKKDAYYAEAATWGYNNEIISGVGENSFAPDDNITRQDLASMIYRYAKHLGADTSKKSNLSKFSDTEDISEYALEAMQWAVGSGIIVGSDNKLSPKGEASRAQAAAILQRCVEYILK